jgi:hypothetical protein
MEGVCNVGACQQAEADLGFLSTGVRISKTWISKQEIHSRKIKALRVHGTGVNIQLVWIRIKIIIFQIN